MKSALQFGAGNIGRGFMGQLFWEIGYGIVFVDVNERLTDLLNERKAYPLRILDAETRKKNDVVIDGVRALDLKNRNAVVAAVSSAAVISTAVGVENLPSIAGPLAEGIEARRRADAFSVDVYLCENSLHASEILKTAVFARLKAETKIWAQKNVGFIQTAVMRIVPQTKKKSTSDPLLVVSDAYHRLPFDNRARRAAPPPIEGLRPVEDFTAEMTKKMYTYNLAHAALGYLGGLKGFQYIHESFDDGMVVSQVEDALSESMSALIRRYPNNFESGEDGFIVRDIKLRFSNPLILDTVKRITRDPLRKLGPDERLIGSAKLCLSSGIKPEGISRVCAAALLYGDPDDPSSAKLQDLVETKGIGETLRIVSQVDPDGWLARKIEAHYRSLKGR
jgi:mannitol-1-phosphate 5-dehydrogenase